MSDLRLVIFDVDGTLIDSQAHILAAMDAAFAAHNLPPPARAATLSIVGLSLPVDARRPQDAVELLLLHLPARKTRRSRVEVIEPLLDDRDDVSRDLGVDLGVVEGADTAIGRRLALGRGSAHGAAVLLVGDDVASVRPE